MNDLCCDYDALSLCVRRLRGNDLCRRRRRRPCDIGSCRRLVVVCRRQLTRYGLILSCGLSHGSVQSPHHVVCCHCHHVISSCLVDECRVLLLHDCGLFPVLSPTPSLSLSLLHDAFPSHAHVPSHPPKQHSSHLTFPFPHIPIH